LLSFGRHHPIVDRVMTLRKGSGQETWNSRSDDGEDMELDKGS
jgi:hypothetical protein